MTPPPTATLPTIPSIPPHPIPGHGRGHGHSLASSTPLNTGSPTRTTARPLMVKEEKYDHEDDYDSDDAVYASDKELEGERVAGVSGMDSSVEHVQNPGVIVCSAEDSNVDRVRGELGGEGYGLPLREREYPRSEQQSQEAQEAQLPTPHYWQCHLCAHINPLFPPSPAMSTDSSTDYPQSQQQHNPHQYSASFASLPPSTTQPCTNRDVPARAASHTLEYIEAPERGSWEKRVRDAAAAALATNANAVSTTGTGLGTGPVQTGAWPGAMAMVVSGNVNANANLGGRMPGTGHGRGGVDRVMPPSPLRITAFSSQSFDDHCASTEPTPLVGGPGTGTIPSPGLGTAQAGINYASIPLNYAFSTADSSRSGQNVPVRSRGSRGGSMRTWPGLGGVVEPRVGFRLGLGRGGAWMPVAGYMPAEAGGGPYLYPEREAMKGENTTTCDVAGGGSVFGAGIGGRCWHSRCEGCYDLDAAKRVLGFCAGSEVDMKLYEAWCASYKSGVGIETEVAGGDGNENESDNGSEGGNENEGDDENERGNGSEHDVMELRRDTAASHMQSRMGNPVRYSTGESRILLVQNANSSDDDDARNDNSAKASSDGGEGFFGEREAGNDNGEVSE